MRNENLDKKYEELSVLIDGFLETIHSTHLPDLSDTPEFEREFCVEWDEFEKASLCAFLNEVKRRFGNYASFAFRVPRTTQGQFLRVLEFLGDLDWWDGPYATNPSFDQISSRECIETLSDYVGEEETYRFCRLMNEIIVESLKPM